MPITPISPLKLPDHIFLFSDHNTLPLACEVAAIMSTWDRDMIGAADFLDPIADALANLMLDSNWGVDWLDPSKTQPGFMDEVYALEKWFIDRKGEDAIGNLAADCVGEGLDTYTRIWRDASHARVKPLLPKLKPHEFFGVALAPVSVALANDPTLRDRLIFPSKLNPESVINAIGAACP